MLSETIKIITLGEYGVGKTSIIRKFVDNKFSNESVSTMGGKYFNKKITLNNQEYSIKLQDTEGEENISLTPSYYSNAKGVLMVFDLSNPKTFDELTKWENDLKKKIGNLSDLVIYIVANKKDKILPKQVDKRLNNYKYFEISCKQDDYSSFENLFSSMVNDITNKGWDMINDREEILKQVPPIERKQDEEIEKKDQICPKNWCCIL